LKKIIISTLLASSMFAGTPANVTVKNNGIVIHAKDGNEYVIPTFNLISIEKQPKEKIYYMRWYGFYGDSSRRTEIRKETYEELKRLLLRKEQ
jgi:hypothetical protein